MTDTQMYKILAERERIMIQERELNRQLSDLKEERKPLDDDIEEFLGDEERIELSKWIIKRVDRDGYPVPPCSYVSVKANKKKLVAKKTAA